MLKISQLGRFDVILKYDAKHAQMDYYTHGAHAYWPDQLPDVLD